MITTYDYIDVNKRKTVLLILLFPLSLLVLLFFVLCIALLLNPDLKHNSVPIATQVIDFYWPLLLGSILISTIWTVIAFYEGSGMILRMVNAVKMNDNVDTTYDNSLKKVLEEKSVIKDIPEPKLSEIRKVLENISLTEKLPTPDLYVQNEKGLYVFAVGTKANSAVILTKDAIEKLDITEIGRRIAGKIADIIVHDKKREVRRILENISITAGIPEPDLCIMENEEGLNAFAVGTNKKNCAVILTRGLIDTLDKSEIEAVIAHEVAHIIHQDTKLMMMVTLLIGFFTCLGYIIFRTSFSGGNSSSRKSSNKNNGAVILLLIGLAFLLYGYVVAPLIRFAVSRTREFHADAKSALLTRNPQALISALKKINKQPIVGILNNKINNNELVAPMCIENPLKKKVSLFDALSNLSSTHPPIEKRIEALQVMDGNRLSSY